MKNFILKNKIFLFSLFISLFFYIPYFLNGDYVRDDWAIYSLSKETLIDAYKGIYLSFTSRPILPFFYVLVSRIIENFQAVFALNIIMLMTSVYVLNYIFKSFFRNQFSNFIFLIILLFPLFSYTNIFSPGMQICGNLSLLLWSISIFFLKKFNKNKNLKYIYLSNIFLLLILLSYESTFPLFSLNVFYLSLLKEEKKFIFINIFYLLLSLLFALLIQKFIIPIFFEDISRFRINSNNFGYFAKILLLNLIIQFNVYFSALDLFFKSFFSGLYFKELLNSIFIFTLILLFCKNIIKKKNNYFNYKSKYFFLFLLLFFFLNGLMHAVALTIPQFYSYNNRSLIGMSVLLAFFVIIVDQKIINQNIKILFFLIKVFIIIFSLNIVKHFQLQYVDQKKVEIFNIKKIINNNNEILDSSSILIYSNNKNFFLKDIVSYENDNFDLDVRINNANINYSYFAKINIYDINYLKFCSVEFMRESFYKESLEKDFLNGKKIIAINRDISLEKYAFINNSIDLKTLFNCDSFLIPNNFQDKVLQVSKLLGFNDNRLYKFYVFENFFLDKFVTFTLIIIKFFK